METQGYKQLPSRKRLKTAAVLLSLLAFSPTPLKAALARPETHGVGYLRATRDQTNGFEETQLTQFLQMDVQKFVWDKLSLTFSGRNKIDFQKNSLGRSQKDDVMVFMANLSLERLPLGFALKAGRQYFYATATTAHFDGLSVDWRGLEWIEMSGFSGRPVALLGQRLADGFTGGSVKLGARRRAYVQLGAVAASHKEKYAPDQEATLTLFTRLADNLSATGNLSALNKRPNTASARLQYYVPNWGMTIAPQYFKQLYTADLSSQDLSPYVRSMAYDMRFERYSLFVSKSLSAHLSLSGGGDLTMPQKRHQLHASLASSDLFVKGLEATLFASQNAQGSRKNVSVTGSIGYKVDNSLQLIAGTSQNEARDRNTLNPTNTVSRTYFADMRFSMTPSSQLSLSPNMTKISGLQTPVYRFEATQRWKF